MKYIYLCLFLFSSFAFSQSKPEYNRKKVIFPGCQSAEDLELCFENKVLQFIDSSLTKSIKTKIIRYSKKDTLDLSANLFFNEEGDLIKKMSGFQIYMDSLKNELNYLEDSFPKVLPVLDKYDNGVADYKNLLLGFKINRADSTIIPIKNYIPKDVPFSLVEQVPVYPGCAPSLLQEAARKCMSNAIGRHVLQNFNTNLASTLNLPSGVIRIYVGFKIDKKGKVVDILTRAPHPALEKEARRVINLLPQLESPGMQKGKAVNVPYGLPITFNIAETAAQRKERKRLKRKKTKE